MLLGNAENMEMEMEGVDVEAELLLDLDLIREMTEKEMSELSGNFIDCCCSVRTSNIVLGENFI